MFYGIAGEYLTERLSKQMFENYLQQELAYFDDKNNSVGALGARLSGDAAAVEGVNIRELIYFIRMNIINSKQIPSFHKREPSSKVFHFTFLISLTFSSD